MIRGRGTGRSGAGGPAGGGLPAVLPAAAVLLTTAILPATAETSTGAALARYVTRHDPGFTCAARTALGRRFLHCAHGPRCEAPNLLFEIRDHSVLAVDGATGDFVDLHSDRPVRVAAGRPLTYTASDVLLAIGCPD